MVLAPPRLLAACTAARRVQGLPARVEAQVVPPGLTFGASVEVTTSKIAVTAASLRGRAPSSSAAAQINDRMAWTRRMLHLPRCGEFTGGVGCRAIACR